MGINEAITLYFCIQEYHLRIRNNNRIGAQMKNKHKRNFKITAKHDPIMQHYALGSL